MDRENLVCSGKDCLDIPKYFHNGMKIYLCEDCLRFSGMQRSAGFELIK